MPKSSQKKLDYNKEYNRKNGYANQARYHETHPSKTYTLRVFSHEADILDYLERQPNKAGKIKELIRAEIQREKEQG